VTFWRCGVGSDDRGYTYLRVATDANGRYEARVPVDGTTCFKVSFGTDEPVNGHFLAGDVVKTPIITVTPAD
jgi:hypothetical protein